jgi:hypothetical protein
MASATLANSVETSLSYQVCANGSFGSTAGDLDLGAAFFAGAGFVYTSACFGVVSTLYPFAILCKAI